MFSKAGNDGLEFLGNQKHAKDVWAGGELNMNHGADSGALAPIGWLVIGVDEADFTDDGEIQNFRYLTLYEEDHPYEHVLPVFDSDQEAEAYILATASGPFPPCGGRWGMIESSALGLLWILLENAEIEKVAWNPNATGGGARCSSAAAVINAIVGGLGELGNKAA